MKSSIPEVEASAELCNTFAVIFSHSSALASTSSYCSRELKRSSKLEYFKIALGITKKNWSKVVKKVMESLAS